MSDRKGVSSEQRILWKIAQVNDRNDFSDVER